MKYMGSKRYALRNGLGQMILRHSKKVERIVDLFCGTGSVAWFAAQNTNRPVLAADLQTYAVVSAQAVIGRDAALDPAPLIERWLNNAEMAIGTSALVRTAKEL